MFTGADTLAFVMVIMTNMTLLLMRDWRINLAVLAVQYAAVFLLVAESWTPGMAIVKLVVGWMICATIAFSQVALKAKNWDATSMTDYLLRGLSGVLMVIVVFALTPQISAFFPPQISTNITRAGMIMIAMGLMQLALSAKPLVIIVGLLTMVSGFEVLHAAVEVSTLLAGLLAVVNLCLALVGVYFIYHSAGEELP